MRHLLSIPPITRRAFKVWHRNLTVFSRTWKVNFFPPLVEALLYLFAIGMGIGSYVQEIEGVPYINFHSPGHSRHRGHEFRILRMHVRARTSGCITRRVSMP